MIPFAFIMWQWLIKALEMALLNQLARPKFWETNSMSFDRSNFRRNKLIKSGILPWKSKHDTPFWRNWQIRPFTNSSIKSLEILMCRSIFYFFNKRSCSLLIANSLLLFMRMFSMWDDRSLVRPLSKNIRFFTRSSCFDYNWNLMKFLNHTLHHVISIHILFIIFLILRADDKLNLCQLSQ